MFCNTIGNSNVAIGYQALLINSTGTFNTAIGYYAGSTNTTGVNNVFIGCNAQGATATSTNTITLGDASITAIRAQVTTITGLSDCRDKTDIQDLSLGKGFVNTLRPVQFTWNTRDGSKVGQQEAGFIAQELLAAETTAGARDYLNLVLTDNPEKLEATPGKLIPILVKAIQELSAEIEELKAEVSALKGV